MRLDLRRCASRSALKRRERPRLPVALCEFSQVSEQGDGCVVLGWLLGRQTLADEAFRMGLVNRLTPPGTALAAAIELAQQIAALPQQ
jgi:enoyl-CoA hydratase/carnithine racemase